MHSIFRVAVPLLSLIISPDIHSQKIRADEVEYSYMKLPLTPSGLRTGMVRIDAAYEEKNQRLLTEYREALKTAEEKYEREMAEYPAQVKAAEEKYEKEMEAYNRKSTGDKIIEKNILKENNRPVKQIPPKPVMERVPEPVLQTSYDYPVLASTYIRLEGYENIPGGLQVIVTLYGFDYTRPRVLSSQRDMVSVGKSTSTYKATYYHVEFSYRHPMALKVLGPDGSELLNIIPPELNIYAVYKSNATDKHPQFNGEMLVKEHEEKILRQNLGAISYLLNDRFGFAQTSRKARLYYVKEKSDLYQDLETAMNEAASGLRMLTRDRDGAWERMKHAAGIWEKALSESDLNDKKARIDAGVTTAICFNLLEIHFAMQDVRAADTILEKMNGLRLSSGERKEKAEWEILFNDLKKRKQSNQI